MSKLKFPIKQHVLISPRGNIQAAVNIMNGDITVEDLRISIESFSEYHPYLRYCLERNFSDSELLERQTENVAAIAATVGKSFNGVATSILKVGASSKGVPSFVTFLGLGTTWGSLASWAAIDFGSSAGFDAIMARFNLSTKGISDLDGINERRELMPPDATMQIEGGIWVGESPYAALQVMKTFELHSSTADVIIKMATSVMSSGKDEEALDSWLGSLNQLKSGRQSAGAYSTPTLHSNLGIMIYKNGKKYFVEEIKARQPTATVSVIPTSDTLLEIQRAARRMVAKTKALDSKLKSTFRTLEKAKDVTPQLAFASRAIKELGETCIKANKALLRDAETYIRESIASIIRAKVKEPEKEK